MHSDICFKNIYNPVQKFNRNDEITVHIHDSVYVCRYTLGCTIDEFLGKPLRALPPLKRKVKNPKANANAEHIISNVRCEIRKGRGIGIRIGN